MKNTNPNICIPAEFHRGDARRDFPRKNRSSVFRYVWILSLISIFCILLPACGKTASNVGEEPLTGLSASEEPKYVISYSVDNETIEACRERYHGIWYGWFVVHDVVGYNMKNGSRLDVVGGFDFDVIPNSPVAAVEIYDCNDASFVVADFTTQMGANDRWVISCPRIIGTYASTMKHRCHELIKDILILEGTVETDQGSFAFELYLRPWGTLWDDVMALDPTGMPSNYRAWYLPRIGIENRGQQYQEEPFTGRELKDCSVHSL
ncbi:MAG: hypothetical protein IJH64_04220 [Oscillospiraceae bacterium]|nr:hypothetical protein [Clostridia bacterium]MBR0341436.1 hypothetical protein [Oscillospiraceae bacterium]